MDQQWKLEQRNILLRMEILQNLAKRANALQGQKILYSGQIKLFMNQRKQKGGKYLSMLH